MGWNPRTTITGILALSMIAAGSESLAQGIACPPAGTSVTVDNDDSRMSRTFRGQEGPFCIVTYGRSTDERRRLADLWDERNNPLRDGSASELERLFPLKVGNTVTLPLGGTKSYTMTVERLEKVKIRAGEFDAFLISQDMAFSHDHLVVKLWYAPSVHMFIKYGVPDSEQARKLGFKTPSWEASKITQ